MNFRTVVAVIVLMAATVAVGGGQTEKPAPKTRAFYMGFTPFPSDITKEAHDDMAQFLKQNADIVAQHMESVPWTEALNGDPLPQGLMNAWNDRKNLTPPGAKVYLALNPGRNELADYWNKSEHDPLPEQFKGKTFSDPIVKKAYLNYCNRAIAFFHPDFMAIGIEVNELVFNAPQKFPAYAELHEYVYKELKKEHPTLPIFASVTLHGFLDTRRPQADRDRSLEAIKKLMPFNDLVGISFYPFFGNLSDQVDASFNFLTEQFDEFKKPYAIAETGEAAEDLTLQMDGKPWHIHGTPAKQLDYYQKLFSLARRRPMKFIITFAYKDYDALWKKIASGTDPTFQAWQDTGLVDEKGARRPAYQLWKEFYDMPVVP